MFDTERFIGEIHCRPCLWNTHLDVYSNRIIRQQAWVDTASVIFDGWDCLRAKDQDNKIKDLQKKWKSLRDYYNREKHKITEEHTGGAFRKKRKAPFLNMLQFLSVTKTASNIVTSLRNGTAAAATDTTEYRKESVHNNMPVCQNTLINMQNQSESDPNMSFLMTILPDMKTMNEKQNFEFRLEVMNLIKRIKYDDPAGQDSKIWFNAS